MNSNIIVRALSFCGLIVRLSNTLGHRFISGGDFYVKNPTWDIRPTNKKERTPLHFSKRTR